MGHHAEGILQKPRQTPHPWLHAGASAGTALYYTAAMRHSAPQRHLGSLCAPWLLAPRGADTSLMRPVCVQDEGRGIRQGVSPGPRGASCLARTLHLAERVAPCAGGAGCMPDMLPCSGP
jgi:hypothetical protein